MVIVVVLSVIIIYIIHILITVNIIVAFFDIVNVRVIGMFSHCSFLKVVKAIIILNRILINTIIICFIIIDIIIIDITIIIVIVFIMIISMLIGDVVVVVEHKFDLIVCGLVIGS